MKFILVFFFAVLATGNANAKLLTVDEMKAELWSKYALEVSGYQGVDFPDSYIRSIYDTIEFVFAKSLEGKKQFPGLNGIYACPPNGDWGGWYFEDSQTILYLR